MSGLVPTVDQSKLALNKLIDRRQTEQSTFEMLEIIVVSVVLALIVRHFVFEPFVIPTGSMAPAYHGQHYIVGCRNCQVQYAVNPNGKTFEGFTASCQICGDETSIDSKDDHEGQLIEGWTMSPSLPFLKYSHRFGGDKIVVDKSSYLFEPVNRFDVAVFKYPMNPVRNFLKRVVGLPGERIKLQFGDIFVNGKLLRKPEDIQLQFWQTIFDLEYSDIGPNIKSLSYEPSDSWQASPDWHELQAYKGLSRTDSVLVLQPPLGQLKQDGFKRAEYKRQIRDHCSYNAVATRSFGTNRQDLHFVSDLRLTTKFSVAKANNKMIFGFVENDSNLQLEISFGNTSKLSLYRFNEQTELKESPGRQLLLQQDCSKALLAGQVYSLDFSFYDRRATVKIDERPQFVWDDQRPKRTVNGSSFYFEGPASGAVVANMKLSRDICYFDSGSPDFLDDSSNTFDEETGEFVIPENSFLGLGDNQTNSSDGRTWGFFRRGHLIGRATLFFGANGFKFIQ